MNRAPRHSVLVPRAVLEELRDNWKAKDPDGLYWQCFHCLGDEHENGEIEHEADCPVLVLQALLGGEDE